MSEWRRKGVRRIDLKIIASDPDRDLIYVVDIPSRTITKTFPLAANSEPGRVAVDTKGRAHVALRKSGNIATIYAARAASAIGGVAGAAHRFPGAEVELVFASIAAI